MNTNSTIFDVIVIGGGPAGMMAAARASARGKSVLLLEKNTRLGKKLSITGGGRCNVTNNQPVVREMVQAYKKSSKFLFSTFTQHGVQETKDWFLERGLPFVEENEGRLFPDTYKAETVCQTLETELKKQDTRVILNAAVKNIERDSKTKLFAVATQTEIFYATSCVVATGGFSRPETGSTGEGFSWLQKLGHTIAESNFALVPIRIQETWVSRVSGVVLSDVKITVYADAVKKEVKRGKVLFTHLGLSGPTILNMSSLVSDLLTNHSVKIQLDLFPDKDHGTLKHDIQALLITDSNKKLKNILATIIPKALVEPFLETLDIEGETKGHSVRSEDRQLITQTLKSLEVSVSGLLGADKAVISGGGAALNEINFKTMESKIVPGLYLIGDILDIDRPSGGYSLQLCWSTGFVAGDSV